MTLLILITALAVSANAFDDSFEQGLEAYEEGRFDEAIEAFERLIEQNIVEPAVFYNLANAYYRAGRLGPAIANYERTLQINPNLGDARENLLKCVNETQRRLSKPPPSVWEQGLLFWHQGMSPQTVARLATIGWFLFWGLLIARLLRPVRYLRRAAALAAFVTLLFAASLWVKSHPQNIAVASAPRVAVHYGTNEAETVRFELYEGDRVIVDRRQTGWARVITTEGERGWARETLLTFVGPPYDRAAAPIIATHEEEAPK